MIVIDGKMVSELKRDNLQLKVAAWKNQYGMSPGLAVVLVGDDPASQVYVRNKALSCEKVGMASSLHPLPADCKENELKEKIISLNLDHSIHGVLVQLPLPPHINEANVLSWIDPTKDVDCLTTENVGLLWSGQARVKPCTPSGIIELLSHYSIPIEGQKAVIIGRSQIVGLPMVQLLQQSHATVTLCHSRTQNLSEHTQQADILVVAAGQPEFLGREDMKKGVVVIDVGIHRKAKEGGGSQLCGDVRFSELEGWAKAVTPVPKGVGPMTITMLLENTLILADLAIRKASN